MRILCPMCGFGREIDLAKIPPRAQMATCPRCEHKFRFRVVDDLPPAEGEAPGASPAGSRFAPSSPVRNGPASGTPTGTPAGTPVGPAAGQDPMAAQRAAAELAWKHLQGVKPEAQKPQAPKPEAPKSEVREPEVREPEVAKSDAPTSDAPPSDGAGPTDPAPGDQQPEAPRYLNATQSSGQSSNQTSGNQASGQESATSPVPFEDLPSHGFFPGLWRTITEVLKTPAAFFRAMPISGGMAKPLVFHLLLAEFMVLSQFFWGMSGLSALSQYSGNQEFMDLGLGLAGTSPIFILVLYPLLLILRLMLMTGVIHFLLCVIFRFTGGKGSGSEATFRVLCYSAAPLILGVVPFFGPLLGGVWSIALTIIGLKEAHRTSGSTAMFAVMLPILMLLAAALGLMQAGLQG
ncbi:MAG: YIP1 family protein [Humidesulfovibrio sp.]|nr:YIP1 family protein [Humidesulfovibrio sp.]